MPLRDVSVPTVTFDDESVRNVGTWITRLGFARVWIDILRDRAREMKRGVGITALLLGECVFVFSNVFFRAGAVHFLLWVLFLLVAGATKLRKTKASCLLRWSTRTPMALRNFMS